LFLGAGCAPKTPNQYFLFLEKRKYWIKEKILTRRSFSVPCDITRSIANYFAFIILSSFFTSYCLSGALVSWGKDLNFIIK
jgi:hypothetical protein